MKLLKRRRKDHVDENAHTVFPHLTSRMFCTSPADQCRIHHGARENVGWCTKKTDEKPITCSSLK